jgi:hypothetical protein
MIRDSSNVACQVDFSTSKSLELRGLRSPLTSCGIQASQLISRKHEQNIVNRRLGNALIRSKPPNDHQIGPCAIYNKYNISEMTSKVSLEV